MQVMTMTIDIPRTITVCTCGATVAPDGKCYNVGTCADADAVATRGATGQTAKFAVPAAWNARGGVD
jgi:hypothetical protein